MVRLRKMRMTAYIACLLLVCMYVAPAAPVLAAVQMETVKQKVIAFPFAVSDAVVQPGIGENIPTSLVEYAHGGDAFDVIAFSKRHPSLQRAILVERTMSEKDLLTSYGAGNQESALKIAREMRGDLALIGDVDQYKFDAEKNISEVQVSAVLVDVRSGKVVKNMTVAGTTPDNSKPAHEDEAAALAVGNAVTKMAEEVGLRIRTAEDPGDFNPVAVKKSSKKKTLLWSLILGLGLGIAVSGGGSSSGSGGGGGFEPPPDPPSP